MDQPILARECQRCRNPAGKEQAKMLSMRRRRVSPPRVGQHHVAAAAVAAADADADLAGSKARELVAQVANMHMDSERQEGRIAELEGR